MTAETVIQLQHSGDSVTIVAAYDEPITTINPPPYDTPMLPFSFIATRELALFSDADINKLVLPNSPIGRKVDVSEVKNVDGSQWWKVYQSPDRKMIRWIKRDWY